MKKVVYISHPMTGLKYEEIKDWYDHVTRELVGIGYDIMCPLMAGELKPGEVIKPGGYDGIFTDHGICQRDKWMVNSSDILMIDFTKAKKISVGCIKEQSWGKVAGKHIVVVLDKNNPNDHAFVRDEADLVFDTLDKALKYLRELKESTIS